MPTVSMKDLLTSGVHFGHQTRRWNPKMKPYIFSERGGIYIIDLQKTTVLIDEAYAFLRNVTGRNGVVLFVGTKKQCQESIKEQAERVGMPYVNGRWLGGLLTNFVTLSKRIKRLHELRQLTADGSLELLPARDQIKARGELAKLENNLGGVADMERLPDAVFVVDPRKEAIVVKEANKLGIPIVALVDTNCDPDEIQYIIPGNDDAIRSCSLIVRVVADAVGEGRAKVAEAEFARKQAEEKEAAERAAREAVEQAAREAAEKEAAEKEAAEKLAAEQAAARPMGAPLAAPVARAPVEVAAPQRPAARPAEEPAKVEARKEPAATEKPKAAEPPVAKAEEKPERPKADGKAEKPKAEEKPAKPEAEEKPAKAKPEKPKADEKPAKPKAEEQAEEAKGEKPKAEEKAEKPKAKAAEKPEKPKATTKAPARKTAAKSAAAAAPASDETKDD